MRSGGRSCREGPDAGLHAGEGTFVRRWGELGQQKLPETSSNGSSAPSAIRAGPGHYAIRLPSAAPGLVRSRRVGRERNEAHEPALRTHVIAGRFGGGEPEPSAAMRAVGREFSDLVVAHRHAQMMWGMRRRHKP